MNTNRALGVVIFIFYLLLLSYLVFRDLFWIEKELEIGVVALSFFIMTVLLLIAARRLEKKNDTLGGRIGYIAFFTFVGNIAFPLLLFAFFLVFTGTDLPNFFLLIFPIISSVAILFVIYRLFLNNKFFNSTRVITDHPYK
jgi:hypothetical protein